MNADESRISELLRSKKPAVSPPSDLEGRIHAKLAGKIRSSAAPRWPWIAAAACLVLAMMISLSQNEPSLASAPATSPGPPPVTSSSAATAGFNIDLSLTNPAAPLQAEGGAIARDLGRARSFLLNCLPSAGGSGF